MNKKILKYLNYLPFILFFIILFYFSQSVGLKGDDFRYILRSSYNFILPAERITKFWQTIQSAYYDYLIQDSRFISTVILTNVLRSDLKVYQILNPLIITLSFYFGLRLSNDRGFDSLKDIIINSICLLCFFSMTPSLLEDAVFWITGAVFYAWTLLSVVLILRLVIERNSNGSALYYILYSYVSLRSAFTAENMSLSISFICLFFVIINSYFYKDKTYFKGVRRYAFIIHWIFNIIQILSPGIRIRATQFSQTIFEDLVSGVAYFIQSQYISGGFISSLLMIMIAMYVRKYNRNLFFISLIFSIPFLVIVVIYLIPPNNTLIYSNYFFILFVEPFNFFLSLDGYFVEKIIVTFYYFVLSCIITANIICIYKKEKDQRFLCIMMMSFITNFALIFIGGASERTEYFSQFFMIISMCLIFHRIENSIMIRISKVVYLILFIILFAHKISYLSSNVRVNIVRENIFKEIIENGCVFEEVKIPKYRYSLLGNFDLYYSFKESLEKDYLGLEEFQHITFVDREEFGID